MGSIPLGKKTSTFDPKLLQIDLTSEISVIKIDERKKQSSQSNLNIHQIEDIPKNDPKLFIYFLCTKFDALKELSLDDELDDGKPIEIRKIDIDKKVFPKKNKRVNFSNNKNQNLNSEKITEFIPPKRKQFSCGNVVKSKFYKINDLKEKRNSDKISEFIFHGKNFKSPKKLKFHHHHKKHNKYNKDKEYKIIPSLSTIKSKNTNCNIELDNNEDEQKTVNDSLDPIRIILKEMGN